MGIKVGVKILVFSRFLLIPSTPMRPLSGTRRTVCIVSLTTLAKQSFQVLRRYESTVQSLYKFDYSFYLLIFMHLYNKVQAVWLECIQEPNEVIFVPSGWYHQVHNLVLLFFLGVNLYEL